MSRTEQIKRLFIGDKWIWWAIGLLMISSLFFVMSSSSVLSYQKYGTGSYSVIFKHFGMLLLSLTTIIVVSRIRPRVFSALSTIAVVVSAVGLLATLFFGVQINGSARWLSIGGMTIQPSEIAKISLILFTARELTKNSENLRLAFWHIMAASAVICGLIMFENLSTFLLLSTTIGAMMFIGRVPMRYLLGTVLVGVSLLALVIVFAPYAPVKNVFPRAMTWHNRVERYIDGNASERSNDDDYQAHQAHLAVASGGLTGKGLGKSYIKNFLPMAFSDFIFSIILEEAGIFGLFVIVGCFVVIFFRAFAIARKCERQFHIYTILGLAILITMQATINMFVGVGLMPVTGQTLPLVSMGGSSNVLMGVAFGIMLSISAHCNESTQAKPAKAKETENEADDFYDEAEAIRF